MFKKKKEKEGGWEHAVPKINGDLYLVRDNSFV